jgi:hypothetical protein
MPVADAPSAATALRSSNRRTNSSSTKTAPAIGALKAVARPAPAPAANSALQSGHSRRKIFPTRWATLAPIWALATERKPGADREHTAAEFHPDELKRRLQDFLVQHGFDMGDAAP